MWKKRLYFFVATAMLFSLSLNAASIEATKAFVTPSELAYSAVSELTITPFMELTVDGPELPAYGIETDTEFINRIVTASPMRLYLTESISKFEAKDAGIKVTKDAVKQNSNFDRVSYSF